MENNRTDCFIVFDKSTIGLLRFILPRPLNVMALRQAFIFADRPFSYRLYRCVTASFSQIPFIY